jgi:HTH-type transcriptional regulator/antitoxin HigA
LKVAFQRLELVFQAPDGSPEADEMEVWVTLIEAYERKHYPIWLAAVAWRSHC